MAGVWLVAMARKKKQIPIEGQGGLFGDKTSEDKGQRGKVPIRIGPSATVPAGGIDKPEIYNGLDIDRLIAKISALAETHGAAYTSGAWNGAGIVGLNLDNKIGLEHYINMLHKTEVHEISKIRKILKQIEDFGDENIIQWKKKLLQAINNGDEELYKKLADQ